MGKIEEIIFENYKKAIVEGNLDQAKKAVELATSLKEKVESEGFVDYDSLKVPASMVLGKFFNPMPYKYSYEAGVIELATSTIALTSSENRLFWLFSENESKGKITKLVSKQDVAKHMWGQSSIAPSAIRIAIHRLRRKIELDPKNPQVLISLHERGYVFLGNKVEQF